MGGKSKSCTSVMGKMTEFWAMNEDQAANDLALSD